VQYYILYIQKQVLPKVILGRVRCYRSRQRLEWTHPLHAQYPLQTNPVTQLRVRYIYTAMPHASYTLHCASCPIPLPKKKFAFFLTGDIHAQSSHWNNGKMKIAYNSAYVQIETFSFTFAQQAIMSIFVPTSKKSLYRTPKVQANYFLPIMSDCTLIVSIQSIG